MRVRWLVLMVLMAALLVPTFVSPAPAVVAAAGECDTSQGEIYFPETKKCALKMFHDYWLANGGLAQQGLPTSDDFMEISAADGKTYKVQYFERARFEFHPEQTDPRYKVLLGLVGSEQYKAKYPQGAGAPTSGTCAAGEQFFQQTRYCVPARFYAYWQGHGGLAQQGLPISSAFMEKNPTDGKDYLTQYFERARFEYHPEIADPNFQVLLGLLGREQYDAKYPGISPIDADSLNDGNITARGDEKSQVRHDRGGLRITVNAPNYYDALYYHPGNTSPASAYQRLGFKDQRVEVEFAQVSGPVDGTVNLVCRLAKDNDNHFVLFRVGPNNGYVIIRAVFGPGENDYKTIAGGRTAPPQAAAMVGTAPTKLRADCVGDTFTLYVNGQKVAEGRDSTITEGERVGFEAETFDMGGMDVVFRNFTTAIVGR